MFGRSLGRSRQSAVGSVIDAIDPYSTPNLPIAQSTTEAASGETGCSPYRGFRRVE